MAFYENFWDCPACGTKGVSALRKRKCPGCWYTKTAQDKEHRSSTEITDEEGLALANGEPYWTCSSCGSVNLEKNTDCTSCGNPFEGTDPENQVIELGSNRLPDYTPPGDEQWYGAKQSETQDQEIPEPDEPRYQQSVETKTTSVPGPPWKIIASVILILAALGGIIGWLVFHTTTLQAEVTGFSWSREVQIEKYQAVHRSGWSFPPSDAYNVSSSTRIHHYEDITVTRTRQIRHPRTCFRDRGNGSTQSYDCSYDTTEKYQEKIGERPVYDTWYEYDLDIWAYERTTSVKGNDRSPHWPEYTLNREGQEILGAERVGGKSEEYTVHFRSIDKEKKEYSYSPSMDEWLRYDPKATYELRVNRLGQVRNNPLKDKEETNS